MNRMGKNKCKNGIKSVQLQVSVQFKSDGLCPFNLCPFRLSPFRSVALFVCGRSGLWPFPFVAVSFYGRFGLWPFQFEGVSVRGR